MADCQVTCYNPGGVTRVSNIIGAWRAGSKTAIIYVRCLRLVCPVSSSVICHYSICLLQRGMPLRPKPLKKQTSSTLVGAPGVVPCYFVGKDIGSVPGLLVPCAANLITLNV